MKQFKNSLCAISLLSAVSFFAACSRDVHVGLNDTNAVGDSESNSFRSQGNEGQLSIQEGTAQADELINDFVSLALDGEIADPPATSAEMALAGSDAPPPPAAVTANPSEQKFHETMNSVRAGVRELLKAEKQNILAELMKILQTVKAGTHDSSEQANKKRKEMMNQASNLIKTKKTEIQKNLEALRQEIIDLRSAEQKAKEACRPVPPPPRPQVCLPPTAALGAPLFKLEWTPEQRTQCMTAWSKYIREDLSQYANKLVAKPTPECEAALDSLNKIVQSKVCGALPLGEAAPALCKPATP